MIPSLYSLSFIVPRYSLRIKIFINLFSFFYLWPEYSQCLVYLLPSRVDLLILLGFRYLASSIPSISLAGVAIGVGSVLASSASSIPRNPTISNSLVRRSPTGSSLAEASGSIGIVHSLLILYAFFNYNFICLLQL